MKIIHFTSHIGQGGDWTIIKSLTDIFIKNDHQVLICGSGARNTSYKSVEIPLNQGLKGFISSLSKIYQLPNDTDIAHVHSPISLFFAIIYKYLRCRYLKIIFSYHWLTPVYDFKNIIKIVLFKFANIIHSCSEEVKNILEKEYKVNSSKSFLIYPGKDPQLFHIIPKREKNKLRQKYDIDNNNFILLFVGRLAPEKNISLILDYLANTNDKKITLIIAGDGDQKQELLQKSLSLNIDKKVVFLGRVEQIEEIYAIADLLVLPSSSMETFGMVVIEAAFCGIPTLRSDLPGAKDQINHGENGFIFAAQQPETMFETLDRIVSERFKLPEIGKQARSNAMNKFTTEKMYDNFLNLYQKMLDQK
ncbi:MAG: glycosyltransferase family 4 protein [Xenococcus sp. MO_188.B8]|nr:glycosyltransferase family 4 protein [Xenococcus sp. MO_188.B8]